ncbi:MAG TPA: cyclase family protein [Bacillota bacterium]|nr:cyclase family protein [Bacillota bacterium]
MKIIDLTHVISEDMPVYPGTETPKLNTANTLEKDGFKETLMIMYSHTGTHMDPPAHLYAQGATLDAMPITNFVGKGFVVDCTDLKEGELITMDKINRNKAKVEEAEFILFNTGWSRYWGKDEYYGKFPVADKEVVEYLARNKKKGFGVDVISIDSMEAEDLPSHQVILSSGMVIIENLVNLDQVGSDIFTVCLLPLKWKDADGSPIRAIAILDD